MTGSMIHFEQRGFVGLATIDRQERRNALNGELCDQLARPPRRRIPTCARS